MAKRRERRGGATPGDLLRILRTEAGLTQSEMAERMGKSQVGYSHYETGESTLPFERAGEFARALGMVDDRGEPLPEVFLQAVGLINIQPNHRSPAELLQDWFSGAAMRRIAGLSGSLPQKGVAA